ncbi:umecyanin-like [Corylus avellana]|uniref:umecyanin-like n=1 Tax=Corylus avellana TaxID=13451 RepID=UPI001E20C7E0|nr:umecyanin-like [Corylus avellana]
MATTMNVRLLLVVLLIAAAATVLPRTEAADHVVGDATGWIVPGNDTFYSTWAANKTFSVGDVLVFNFATGQHDVATVNKDAFDTCNKASNIALENNGPASINLTNAGENYFICTFGQHCTGGQKLAVNVTGTSTTPSPPGVMAPPPPPPPPPPPSGSSASSLAATFSLILVTIASTIFYLF